MKKLAFLLHDPDIKSGATKSALDLIYNLNKFEDISIIVFTPSLNEELVDRVKGMGIKIIQLPYFTSYRSIKENILTRISNFPKRFVKEVITKLSSYKLNKLLKELSIEYVITNTSVLKLGAYVKQLNPNIKHIWHIREYGIEDQNIVLLGGEKKLYDLMNNYSDHLIFISKSLTQKFIPNLNNTNYSIIYNDISKDYIIENTLTYKKKDPIKLLLVGRLSPGKGQFEVIKEIKKIKELGIPIELDLVGNYLHDNAYYKEITSYIIDNSLEGNIRFLGVKNNMNQVRRNYIFEIIASPFEAFGRVTVEGMLSKHLIIGLNRGATPEIIQDHKNGILYEPDHLNEVITSIYNQQVDVQSIREAGFKEALKYTKGNAAHQFYEVINQIEDRDNLRK